MTYLNNAWYTVAWQNEITSDKPFARTILDTPLALFRRSDGQPVAIHDRCPHRFAPLSMGKVHNDVIQCPYHGLQFNGEGKCVHNPHGSGRIPPTARVQGFPVLEKYNAVWVWMGDPAQADPACLPEFDFMDTEYHACGAGYLHIDANYELESDNILNLSHIEFMHPLFSSPAVSKAESYAEKDGETIWSKRDIYDDDSVPDFLRQGFQIPEGKNVDRWLDVRWNAPALLALWIGGVEAGESREKAARVAPSVHWFTPETAKTTHYFYAMSFPKAVVGEAQAQKLANESTERLRQPFELEDKPIVEAQAQRMGDADFWDLKPISLAGDGAALRAREVLKSLIEKEQKSEVEAEAEA